MDFGQLSVWIRAVHREWILSYKKRPYSVDFCDPSQAATLPCWILRGINIDRDESWNINNPEKERVFCWILPKQTISFCAP